MTNTLFIGKVYRRFDELPSTNDYAAEIIAKSKPPEGTVVRADRQSAGRGQFGSRWESEGGKNLTLSIILYPAWLAVAEQFYLSMAVALGVLDAVRAAGPIGPASPSPGSSPVGKGGASLPAFDVNDEGEAAFSLPAGIDTGLALRLKWPNDLYIGARKTAGILIQNTLSGRHLQASVVGIGLNVNQTVFDPALPNPVSLALAFGTPFDPDAVAERLFEGVERRYLQLKAGQKAAIKVAYEQCLYRLNEPASFSRVADGQIFTGIIRGVTEAGQLRVETENGVQNFELKEVRFA